MSATALIDQLPTPDGLLIPKLFDVKGWVAVVTGGGTGLGLVTATSLARNGCKVFITGRRLEPLEDAIKAIGKGEGYGEVKAVQGDSSTKEGILKLKAAVEKEEKYINVLINNHGVSLTCPNINEGEMTAEAISKRMFEGESFESWADTYRINTSSYYFLTFAFLPLLAAAKTVGNALEPGNVLNIASLSGITKSSQNGQFSYNAGKAATIHLTKMLATEFARKGLDIRVNTICPGYFPSGMSVKETGKVAEEELQALYRGKYGIPFGRVGTAVDYARCVFGVITNSYMTGSEILIDGSWMATETP